MYYGPSGEAGLSDTVLIARFSRLTELSLESIPPSADYNSLRCLRLQKLRLQDCQDAELALFEPDSLTALQEVTILDTWSYLKSFRDKLDQLDPEAQREAQQLVQIGKFLLSMPSLRVVSGSCKLYLLGIFKEQEGWSRESRGCCNNRSHEDPCFECDNAWQRWRKIM